MDAAVSDEAIDPADTERYFVAVAHARYVMRAVTRIVDEQARKESLESLEHQTLIQVCGAQDGPIRINELADRLDIVPAFASRLVRKLEDENLVKRRSSDEDRRVTLVEVTEDGIQMLNRINERVHVYVDLFKHQLPEKAREDAFKIFAFYVGIPPALNGESSE